MYSFYCLLLYLFTYALCVSVVTLQLLRVASNRWWQETTVFHLLPFIVWPEVGRWWW